MDQLFLTLYKWTNPVFYGIRSNIRFKRNGVRFPYERKEGMYKGANAQKEERYRQKYSLDDIYRAYSVLDYRLNLYQIELMEIALGERKLPKDIRAADVGSKNFYYAAGLERFFETRGNLVSLDGIEVDAYRVYDDFHSRFDHAQNYIKGLGHVHFHPMDVLDYRKKANVITMFLPFVYEEPLLYWGLPIGLYQPENIMRHAYSLLEEGGVWVISNQGKEEKKRQQELLEKLGIAYEDKGMFASSFYAYEIPHYVTIVKK